MGLKGHMLGLPTNPMSMNGALVPMMVFPPSLRFSRLKTCSFEADHDQVSDHPGFLH